MDVVALTAPFLEWLDTLLHPAARESAEAEELHQAVSNLLTGSSASVMLERKADREGSPPPSFSQVLVCGSLKINLKTRSVSRAGREVTLTPKEYELLAFLAENPGEIFTKEQIYQAVWNNDYLLDDSNVMAFIRKLRKKIEPNPDAPRYIQTIWGVGYRFCEEPPAEEDPAQDRD